MSSRLLRPAVLLVIAAVLCGAVALYVWPQDRAGQPIPLPLKPDEQEIVWLYPATSTAQWERLARAVQTAGDADALGRPTAEDNSSVEAGRGTATPELALRWGDGRLVFRWYKLTSDLTPAAWAEALMARPRPPLAVIGGNNTYWARALAEALHAATASRPGATKPLLLLTTATADNVPEQESPDTPLLPGEDERTRPLTGIYDGRTYRFCFTNRQIATAVTRFLWTRPELRPEGDPAYVVRWTDDAYSRDLFEGYRRVLRGRGADGVAETFGFLSGSIAAGLPAPAALGWYASTFRGAEPAPWDVDSSVGPFATPNPFEAKTVVDLLRFAARDEVGRRLLVLTGQAQPSRRFLRDLARSAPDTARRFVVAAGDAMAFNALYRDREVTWPVQDLPFPLVCFCHRNPIDEASGFFRPGARGLDARRRAGGTEDLLVYADIVRALALAYRRESSPVGDADRLAANLSEVFLDGAGLNTSGRGVRLFRPGGRGQRSAGTGEHVVYLRPHFRGERVLPRATIEVWRRQSDDRGWVLAGAPLAVSYDEFEVQYGDRPGDE